MIQSGTKVTGKVTVKPTTAYVGDNTEGKLTLYVPYYGVTGIGQITLSASASGNVQIKNMQILPKKADETSATVTFQLDEGASAPFSDGEEKECEPLPVLVYDNYTITGRDNGFETAANFQGTPVSNSWLGKGTCKYNPTTKTYTQTIDIAINTDTENSRAGAVVVFSPSGRELARFIIEQAACEATNPDKPVINDITINKLVPSGANSANCYIITAPGRYELPAYMGAYSNSELADNLLCKGTPDIVWNDNDSKNKIEFYQGHLSQDKIIIDVNPTKENGIVTGHGSKISPGNAVISINDSKGIKWSWHLWFCDGGAPADQKYADNVYLMDRSLGAKESANIDLSLLGDYINTNAIYLYWQDGLFYQRGRKDPLSTNVVEYDHDGLGGDLDKTNAYPNIFDTEWQAKSSWVAENNKKSKYDPCPAGYRVPSESVWTKSESNFNRLNSNESTFIYTSLTDLSNGNIITYPYAGFIDVDGEWKNNIFGQGTANSEYNSSTILYPALASFTIGKKTYSLQGGLGKSGNKEAPRKFENIKYRVVDREVQGNLLARDDNENKLIYGYKDQGIQIISYKLNVGNWKDQWALVYYHEAQYNNSNWKEYKAQDIPDGSNLEYRALSEGELKEILDAIEGKIQQDAIFSDGWQNILGNIFESLTNAWSSNAVFKKETDTSVAAYNIRCVRE